MLSRVLFQVQCMLPQLHHLARLRRSRCRIPARRHHFCSFLPGAHPLAVSPSIGNRTERFLSGELDSHAENIGSNSVSSSSSAPIAGHPKAIASYASTSSAEKICACQNRNFCACPLLLPLLLSVPSFLCCRFHSNKLLLLCSCFKSLSLFSDSGGFSFPDPTALFMVCRILC